MCEIVEMLAAEFCLIQQPLDGSHVTIILHFFSEQKAPQIDESFSRFFEIWIRNLHISLAFVMNIFLLLVF